MGRIENTLNIENKILQLRNQLEITQQELADKLGVTRATVVALEKGDYNPSLELAFRVAHFFKKQIDEVFAVRRKS
jgi:putative transcriptional regulator